MNVPISTTIERMEMMTFAAFTYSPQVHGAIALLLGVSFLLKNEIASIIDQNGFFVNEMLFLHEILKFPLCISENFCAKIRSCIATPKTKEKRDNEYETTFQF